MVNLNCIPKSRATSLFWQVRAMSFLCYIGRHIALIAVILWLSACQHLDNKPSVNQSDWLSDETIFAQRQVDFSSLHLWQYSAKFSVQSDELREQGNIVWTYSDQANNVRLFGPLGAGQIKLEFDQHGVQLSDSKGVLHRGMAAEGNTAEKLLADITGLPIPLDALAHWLFVLPKPQYAFAYQLNDQANLAALKQLGWQIQFSDYRDYAGNFLPRKLTAIYVDENNRQQDITVKLVTKAWQWSTLLDQGEQ